MIFHVVRWSLGFRVLSAAFLIAMLTACTYFLWLQLATDEKGIDVISFRMAPLLAFAVWAAPDLPRPG